MNENSYKCINHLIYRCMPLITLFRSASALTDLGINNLYRCAVFIKIATLSFALSIFVQ